MLYSIAESLYVKANKNPLSYIRYELHKPSYMLQGILDILIRISDILYIGK